MIPQKQLIKIKTEMNLKTKIGLLWTDSDPAGRRSGLTTGTQLSGFLFRFLVRSSTVTRCSPGDNLSWWKCIGRPERWLAVSVVGRKMVKAPPGERTSLQKCSRMALIVERFHSFTCTPVHLSTDRMNHTCLCLSSRSWSSFTDPRGIEGWVGIGTTTAVRRGARDRLCLSPWLVVVWSCWF